MLPPSLENGGWKEFSLSPTPPPDPSFASKSLMLSPRMEDFIPGFPVLTTDLTKPVKMSRINCIFFWLPLCFLVCLLDGSPFDWAPGGVWVLQG